jgi:hypothetical protein
MRKPVVLLTALAIVLAPAAPAAAAAASPVFRLSDPRLTELSGLALGHRSPGVLYAQNDSGAAAEFYALDAHTGTVLAVCRVPGARNTDWEDLATGPDPAGRWSVWLADIGDNAGSRSEVRIYRVPEPVVGSGTRIDTGRPDVWRLRYPDGPHDAESLVADPVGRRLYVITKAVFGHSEVFEVPADPDPARVQPMSLIGSIDFAFTGTPGGPNPVGQLTATGAGMSADGTLLAVRTYTDAYLWPVGDDRIGTALDRIGAALRRPPVRVPLPAQPQGEGIAVDGHALLIDSEQRGSAVYRVPLTEAVLARLGEPASSSAAPAGSSPTGSSPTLAGSAASRSVPSPVASSSVGAVTRPGGSHRWLILGALAGVVSAAVAFLLGRRVRRQN